MVASMTVRKKPPPPLDRGWAWMIVVGVHIYTFFMVGLAKAFGLFLLEFVHHFGVPVALATMPFSIGAFVYAFGGVFIYVFFMVGVAKSYGLFLLAFLQHFGVTTAYAAMPISISAFVYAVGAPSAILAAEVLTPQKVVIIGACVGLIGIALSSLLFSMAYVIFFFGVCFGVGNSCFYGNGLVMIGKYFRKRRSLATGLGLAGASIGQFVMPPFIEYLLENYGLGGALLIIGGLYFNCAISGALFRPIEQYGPEEPQEEIEAKPLGEGSGEENEVLVKRTGFGSFEEDISTPENGASGANGDIPLSDVNGVIAGQNGNTYISFRGDLHSQDTSDLVDADENSPVEKRKSKRWSEILEEDEKNFLERKALLASTGSIFLVSPSVLDVSDIDRMAHGVDPPTEKSAPKGIRRIFDFSVLKSYITIFFIIISFLSFFGYFNFILFLPAILVEKGITKYDKALLISICGVGDLIARIGTGIFADLNLIPRYKLKATACVLSGVNIFIFVYADVFSWLGVHCFLYGFLGGAYVCLMSVVLVDFVGVVLMAKNLAVILLIQGIGAATGQIFLGWIRDIAGSFDIVIILCSVTLIIGGASLFTYPVVRRWEDARLEKVKQKQGNA